MPSEVSLCASYIIGQNSGSLLIHSVDEQVFDECKLIRKQLKLKTRREKEGRREWKCRKLRYDADFMQIDFQVL